MRFSALLQSLRYPKRRKLLALYRAAETMSEAEIFDFQLSRLKKIFSHFYENFAFYRALCQEAGVTPEEIQSLSDLRRLPVVDKALIRENEEILRQFSPRAVRRSTSGSSGENFHFYLDESARETHSTFRDYYNERLGLSGGLTIGIWGGNLKKPEDNSFLQKLKLFVLHSRLLPGYGMDEVRAAEYLEDIRLHAPSFVYGYPSYLAFLARVGEKRGIPAPGGFVLVASGEQMSPQDRAAIERYFQIPVYNRYGSCEFSTIAHELPGVGGFYVNPVQFLLETNESGEILVTDLWNFATPFLRYNIGDCGKLERREGKTLITELYGRANDVIFTPAGKMIPSQFWTILSRMCEEVLSFQVVQVSDREVKMRTKSEGEFDPAPILENFNRNFGDEMILTVTRTEAFETTKMGKHKFVIRKEQV